MSDLKINIRFLYWHFQLTKQNKIKISFNKFHYPKPKDGLFKIYEWNLSNCGIDDICEEK